MFRYLLAIAFLPAMLSAQHPEHQTPRQTPMKPMAMMMNDPLGVSMERMGSGTTWIPDAVPLPARHVMSGSWLLMLHGFGFVQYDKQGGRRGDDQFGSLNWAMRSEEHTSELQSQSNLVCRLLLEKKKKETSSTPSYSSSRVTMQ